MSADLTTWPTIEEAAHTLGWSTKTIRRKGMQLRKRPRPGKTPETIVCPEDVERYMAPPVVTAVIPTRDTRDMGVSTAPNGVPAVQSEEQPQDFSGGGVPLDAISAIIQEALRTALPAPPPPDPMFVRVERATEITGLSSRMLSRLARLRAIDGLRDERVVKLRRVDLDAVDVSLVAIGAPRRKKKRTPAKAKKSRR